MKRHGGGPRGPVLRPRTGNPGGAADLAWVPLPAGPAQACVPLKGRAALQAPPPLSAGRLRPLPAGPWALPLPQELPLAGALPPGTRFLGEQSVRPRDKRSVL